MPRVLTRAAALAGALVAAWVVAPAFSAQPYVPAANGFEQPLTGVERIASAARGGHEHGHGEEGPVTHVSAILDAPARFDIAGLGGELRAVELRGRTTGGEWTDWTETANGDPVWFGGMDQLQLRSRGFKPAGRIHYVNVSGNSTEGAGILTRARQAVNGVVSASVAVLGADVAVAGSDRPSVVRRRQWGANQSGKAGCKPRRNASRGRVKAAAVHHTVSAVKYSKDEAAGMVLGICQYHRNGNGWDDIGYNALVDRFGTIYEGRAGGLGKANIGAHAQGVNYQTTGVAVLGTHSSKPARPKALNGVARWLAWKLPRHGLGAAGKARLVSQGGSASRYSNGEVVRTKKIFGHRVVNYTDCPGNALDGQLLKIKRKTKRKIARAGGPPDGGKGGNSGGVRS